MNVINTIEAIEYSNDLYGEHGFLKLQQYGGIYRVVGYFAEEYEEENVIDEFTYFYATAKKTFDDFAKEYFGVID